MEAILGADCTHAEPLNAAISVDAEAAAVLWGQDEDQYAGLERKLKETIGLLAVKVPGNALRALLLKRLGKLHRLQQRFVEAEADLKEAVQIAEETLGMTHRTTARLRVKLCKVYDSQRWQDRWDRDTHCSKIESVFLGRIQEAEARGDAACAAVLRSDLACIERYPNDKSRQLLELAVPELIKHKDSLGDEPAMSAASLGSLLFELGQYDQAMRHFSQALGLVKVDASCRDSIRARMRVCRAEQEQEDEFNRVDNDY